MKKETGYFDLLQQAMDAIVANDLVVAIERCNDALAIDGDKPEALCVLGFVAMQMEDIGRAIELLERAHALDPDCRDYADALAVFNARTGKLTDSLYFAKLALALEPHPQLHAMIPAAFRDYRLALDNATPSPHYVDAMVFTSLRQYAKAIDACYKEFRVNPHNAKCYLVLGRALAATGQYGKAMGAYHAAAHIDQTSAELFARLGECLCHLGRSEEGRVCLDRAVRLAPGDRESLTTAVAALAFSPAGAPEDLAAYNAALEASLSDGVEKIDPEDLAPDPGEGKIRIGFISDGFCTAAQAPFLESLFKNLDRGRFIVHGYQQNSFQDSVTTRFKSQADEWRPILDVDDDTAANIIARDGIHILIDACGDAESRALAIFARRPVAVQLGWLGWPRGLGLDTVDGWLDEAAAQASADDGKSRRLPGGLVAFDAQSVGLDFGDVAVGGASQEEGVTFGGRCDLAYLSPVTAAAWSAALRAVPQSRLLLGRVETIPDEVRTRVQEYFSHFGVIDRIVFQKPQAGRTAVQVFYASVDMVLDSVPASDGGFVCEALAAGAPVVALEADRRTALTGPGMLRAAGKAEWVARDEAEFAGTVAMVADAIAKKQLTPAALREEIGVSPLCDGAAFARGFEALCTAMLKAGA